MPIDRLILQLTTGVNVDVSAVNGLVDGYIIDKLQSPQEILQTLLANFGLIALIRNDVVIFKHQLNEMALDLELAEIGVTQEAAFKKNSTSQTPTDMHLRYISNDGSYTARVTSELLELDDDGVRDSAQYTLPAVMSSHLAAKLVASRLKHSQNFMEIMGLHIDQHMSGLECGDVLNVEENFDNDLQYGKWQVTSIDRELGCQIVDLVAANDLTTSDAIIETQNKVGNVENILVQGPALIFAMNLPILPNDLNSDGYLLHLAAFSKPWLSKLNVYQNIDTSFIKRTEITQRATVGKTLWDFYSGPVDRFDWGNKLRVRLYGGSLSSVSDAEILAGKNMAAILNADGEWEILQFKTATLTAQNEYELAHFIRGKFGTENAMRNFVASDANFILLDERIAPLPVKIDELLGDLLMTFGPANRTIEDKTYKTENRQHEDVALKPFAPVHVDVTKQGDDLVIGWLRQTRFGGENWQLNQVPLNEQIEAYEIEIWQFDGSIMLRELAVTEPETTYSAAMQIADFGGLAVGFKVKIYQISALVGRGTVKEENIYV